MGLWAAIVHSDVLLFYGTILLYSQPDKCFVWQQQFLSYNHRTLGLFPSPLRWGYPPIPPTCHPPPPPPSILGWHPLPPTPPYLPTFTLFHLPVGGFAWLRFHATFPSRSSNRPGRRVSVASPSPWRRSCRAKSGLVGQWSMGVSLYCGKILPRVPAHQWASGKSAKNQLIIKGRLPDDEKAFLTLSVWKSVVMPSSCQRFLVLGVSV